MIDLKKIAAEADEKLKEKFNEFEKISEINTKRVLDAFREERVSDSHFLSSSGYGYSDSGRDTLERVFARVFGCESAVVRHNIVSGTHALAIGLFGLLRPGDILLSVSGKPYDTLDEVIGISGKRGDGSLADFGIEYRQIELKDGRLDFESIYSVLSDKRIKTVFVQRSRGYSDRRTLSHEEIGELVKLVKSKSNAFVMVDNCYGEFVGEKEPTHYGADLVVGSLIKNPGGGMAESGGYFAGSARAVNLASYRMTSVGIGSEAGASLGQTKSLFKGLFYAPHTTCQALKTAAFAAYVFEKCNFSASPLWSDERYDIIQTIQTGNEKNLIAFCRGLQSASPIDSFAVPEPWDMPGYSDKVIMAAGAFTQGASIELSADGPLREPYTVFFQGGLTYESGKIGILSAAEEVLNQNRKA